MVLLYLGDNCFQSFHLGRYIVGYRVRNLVLRRRVSGAVKRDFRTYIRRYTSPNKIFEYGYPHSNALLTFFLQTKTVKLFYFAPMSSGCQLHKAALQLHIFTGQPMKSDVTYITGYTVANLWRYPIRRRVAFASALECFIMSWLICWFS